MKKTILSLTTILALGLTGCGGSGSGDADTTAKVSMTIKYADGSTFGVTRAEDKEVNGGYPVYNVGTGEQNGWIEVDGSVNDINGVDLGVCQDALDERGDFTEECTVLSTNPTIHPEEPDTDKDSNNGSHGGTGAGNGNNSDTKPSPKPSPKPDTSNDDDGSDDSIVDPDTDGGATGGTDADSSGAGGQGSETGAGN